MTEAMPKPLPRKEPGAAPAAPATSRPPRRGRRVLRRLGRTLLGLVLVLLLAVLALGLWIRGRLSAALPPVAGERVVAGVEAPVTIARDGLGVPAISGGSRRDVAFATGFVHAGDRFFQMDLLRRRAAGELAELVGPAALPADRSVRRFLFRAQAERLLARLPAEQQALLVAYSAGVNAGLAAAGERPFEYLLLRMRPAPWRPADSLLVLSAMFLMLEDGRGRHESALGLMRDTLPGPLFEFLTPIGTEWDTPLVGEPLATPPVPGPEVFDARRLPPFEPPPEQAAARGTLPAAAPSSAPAGSTRAAGLLTGGGDDLFPSSSPVRAASNAWAVAGSRTADGRALLALDMHLPLAVPNLWYRASLSWPEAGGPAGMRQVAGVTVPGLPLVAAGSNGAVAWGFTAGRFDASDVVLLDVQPDGDTYLAPGGARRFEHHAEVLHARGAADERLDVLWTVWGPEIDRDTAGRRRAIRWAALAGDAMDLGLAGLETASGAGSALAVARASGIPAVNFVVADAAGHAGWTVAGRLPRRVGFDGRLPASWSDGTRRWDGWLAEAETPALLDPPSGLVWSANNRAVGGAALARLGDGGYVLGARARQIRDDLAALPRAGVADLLRVQLDDRALFLARWRELLLRELSPAALAADPRRPRRRELRQAVEAWGGRAAVDSAGYRLVRDFRERLAQRVLGAATAACRKQDPKFDYLDELDQWEGPLWRLVSERPAHFLDPRRHGWDEELLAVADEVAAAPRREGVPLAAWTWGQRNRAEIRHPLSRALPLVGRWLDMPADPLPGDDHMPRVQAPSYGASERMVVAPGAEGAGLFHMPAGESADPISPHYRDEQAAWVRGEPSPFPPGPAADTLILRPSRGAERQ
jgi:penicillin amidase